MSRKRIITLVLSFFVVVVICTYLIKDGISVTTGRNIKVMEYTPPTITAENSYQIDKYENIENIEWINENEVLTLTKKEGVQNSNSTKIVRYCSIYNLNTKKSRDFREANVDEFLGVSSDKKYFLYSEPKIVPEVGSDKWKKADESGDLLHKNLKLLNLFTGEITDLNTEKINCSAEFRWIGNNKILVNYYTHWSIIGINGRVYVDGNYSRKEHENPNIAGTDDIKDLGDSVEGKFYYTQDIMEKNFKYISTKLCYIDVKTKEMRTLCLNENFHQVASKKNNTIVIGKSNLNGELVNSEVIMDKAGSVVRNIDIPKGRVQSDYILSPDGSKAAYTEGNDVIKSKNYDENESILKVINLKTGNVKEIVKSSTLKDENEEVEYKTIMSKSGETERKVPIAKDINNICWSATGKDLSFTYGSSKFSEDKVNTYIISFDK
ncbi:hypothetical protein NNC19_19025 [Clostridium sp. SHJSY1]|uniref:hypothetical protein n=1 Tax=Clostridium sp. SHJSY1 TaxID=2942483 RepID=UPI002874B739|nr:hypothetical protein [Clostridium sp. SHJSY1]MDS0527788.1 hypothetical protein [Clostridium sp. SHJSY1]